MIRILGAVLAGGRSRRFGADKALALLEGRALIDHVLAAIIPQTHALVICGRAYAPWPVLADLPGPGLGPLGGLAAALAHAHAQGFDSVLSVGCDHARLPADLAARLAPGPAYAADCPIVGLWPATLAPLAAALASGPNRALRHFAEQAHARAAHGLAIANINTTADLAALG